MWSSTSLCSDPVTCEASVAKRLVTSQRCQSRLKYAQHVPHHVCQQIHCQDSAQLAPQCSYSMQSHAQPRHQHSGVSLWNRPSSRRGLHIAALADQSQQAVSSTPADASSVSSNRSGEVDGQAEAGWSQAPTEALSAAEVEERLSTAAGLISTAQMLAPYDRRPATVLLAIWKAIDAVPAAERRRLLDRISPADIVRLWRVAGKRYDLKPQQLAAAIGPDYSPWDDFPERPARVVVFDGKAAVAVQTLGLARFQKAFFLHPESYDVYGRVLLRKGPLGSRLYPLYYRASIEPCVIPATNEVADVQLEYLPPEQLPLEPADLPVAGWPQPKRHLYPFNDSLVDYLRPVGPGVYVGVGWKADSKGGLGKRFLHFLLVRRPDTSS